MTLSVAVLVLAVLSVFSWAWRLRLGKPVMEAESVSQMVASAVAWVLTGTTVCLVAVLVTS